MRRDWIWGWVAALPAIIVAFLTIRSFGLFSENPSIAMGWVLALATVITTGILWTKNRLSLRKIIHSGGDVELVIRPISAFWRAAGVFVAYLGILVFGPLVIEGQAVVQGGLGFLLVGLVSYLWSLQATAYKKPE